MQPLTNPYNRFGNERNPVQNLFLNQERTPRERFSEAFKVIFAVYSNFERVFCCEIVQDSQLVSYLFPMRQDFERFVQEKYFLGMQ